MKEILNYSLLILLSVIIFPSCDDDDVIPSTSADANGDSNQFETIDCSVIAAVDYSVLCIFGTVPPVLTAASGLQENCTYIVAHEEFEEFGYLVSAIVHNTVDVAKANMESYDPIVGNAVLANVGDETKVSEFEVEGTPTILLQSRVSNFTLRILSTGSTCAHDVSEMGLLMKQMVDKL